MKIYEYKITRNFIRETDDISIKTMPDVVEASRSLIDFGRMQEQLIAIFLNQKGIITGSILINIGTVNSSQVSIKTIFKAALLCDAVSLAVAHNHPSGELTPSKEDIRMTETVRSAAHLLDINFLESIIVSETSYELVHI